MTSMVIVYTSIGVGILVLAAVGFWLRYQESRQRQQGR